MAKAKPITSKTMADKIRAALAQDPAGTVSVRMPDGTTVAYDRTQALAELEYWESRSRVEASGRRTGVLSEIRLVPQ